MKVFLVAEHHHIKPWLAEKEFPVFGRCHPSKSPLAAAVVVVIHVAADLFADLAEAEAFTEVKLVLGMSEERLHRGIVPAVAKPRH